MAAIDHREVTMTKHKRYVFRGGFVMTMELGTGHARRWNQ